MFGKDEFLPNEIVVEFAPTPVTAANFGGPLVSQFSYVCERVSFSASADLHRSRPKRFR
jgi:hypothetical protein